MMHQMAVDHTGCRIVTHHHGTLNVRSGTTHGNAFDTFDGQCLRQGLNHLRDLIHSAYRVVRVAVEVVSGMFGLVALIVTVVSPRGIYFNMKRLGTLCPASRIPLF